MWTDEKTWEEYPRTDRDHHHRVGRADQMLRDVLDLPIMRDLPPGSGETPEQKAIRMSLTNLCNRLIAIQKLINPESE